MIRARNQTIGLLVTLGVLLLIPAGAVSVGLYSSLQRDIRRLHESVHYLASAEAALQNARTAPAGPMRAEALQEAEATLEEAAYYTTELLHVISWDTQLNQRLAEQAMDLMRVVSTLPPEAISEEALDVRQELVAGLRASFLIEGRSRLGRPNQKHAPRVLPTFFEQTQPQVQFLREKLQIAATPALRWQEDARGMVQLTSVPHWNRSRRPLGGSTYGYLQLYHPERNLVVGQLQSSANTQLAAGWTRSTNARLGRGPASWELVAQTVPHWQQRQVQPLEMLAGLEQSVTVTTNLLADALDSLELLWFYPQGNQSFA